MYTVHPSIIGWMAGIPASAIVGRLGWIKRALWGFLTTQQTSGSGSESFHVLSRDGAQFFLRARRYPAIAAYTQAKGAEIHWGDETALVNTDVRGRSYPRETSLVSMMPMRAISSTGRATAARVWLRYPLQASRLRDERNPTALSHYLSFMRLTTQLAMSAGGSHRCTTLRDFRTP